MMENENIVQTPPSLTVVVVFFLIVSLTLLLAVCFPNNGYLLVVSGILLLFFLPGYVITNMFFPDINDNPYLRYVLFIVISSIVVTCVAILLTLWKIRLFNPDFRLFSPLFLGTFFVTLCALVIGELQKKSPIISLSSALPEKKTSYIILSLIRPFRQFNTVSLCLLALIVVILIGGFFISAASQYTPSTEFFLLNSEGKSADYSPMFSVNRTSQVMVGIVNREHTPVNYSLVLVRDNTILTNETFSLNNGDERLVLQSLVAISNLQPEKQKIEFRLYKRDNLTEPYRSLHLWIA